MTYAPQPASRLSFWCGSPLGLRTVWECRVLPPDRVTEAFATTSSTHMTVVAPYVDLISDWKMNSSD